MENSKQSLLGLSLAELKQAVTSLGMPGFTAKQIASWMYDKQVESIDGMTNLSVRNRELLKEHYTIGNSAPVEAMHSVDGTAKYLFKTALGDFVETVYIPDADRATLCVSSQVGCKMNCRFCMTGKQGWQANLTAADILNQIYSVPGHENLTNIVFMGQGEPMDNLDEVFRALNALTSDWGYKWSPKRITVSSVGVRKGLKRFLDESDCHVAISLHAPIPELRASMMPAEKGFPIEEVVELLKQYDFSHQRRLSFEYIMFGGLNDTPIHAKEIAKLLKGLDCRVNLIRFHKIPNVDIPPTVEDRMQPFRDYLTNHGIFTTIRASRGEDIFAACGLLSTAKQEGIDISGRK